MSADNESGRPHVARWLSDETWWRDVASQALGGVIAAVIVAGLGVALTAAVGLVKLPSVGRVILIVVIVVLALAVLFFGALGLGSFIRLAARRLKLGPNGSFLFRQGLVAVLPSALALGVFYVVFLLIRVVLA